MRRNRAKTTESKSGVRGIAARAGYWSAGHRKTAIFGWLAFVVLAVFIGGQVGQNKITDADYYVGESKQAEAAIAKAPGFEKVASEVVLIQNQSLTVRDPRFKQAISDVQSRISKNPDVTNVASPIDGKSQVSADGHTALVQFDYKGDPEAAADKVPPVYKAIDEVKADNPGMYVGVYGDGSFDEEVEGAFMKDLQKAEVISLPVTLLILIIAFGALAAAGVPLLLAISAVIASIALVALPSQLLPVDDAIASVMLLIGMAVGVDYSLFYMRREREERAKGKDPRAALQAAAATSGRAVLISGLTVMVAMAGMFLSGDKGFMGFGMGTMLVVAVALVGSLTVLPAMMSWLGDRMYKGRVPGIGRRKADGEQSRVLGAIIDRVMKRPVVSVVVAGGLLVALTIPAFDLQTKVTGPEDLPQSFQSIQAYERAQDQFPGETPPAVVAIEGDVRSDAVQAGIEDLRREAVASGQMTNPIEVEYADDNTLAEVSIPLAGDGFDAESSEALATLRKDVIPATIGKVDAVSVNVSGSTAQNADFKQLLGERMPIVFAFVLGLAFLLLLATFRSVVIPIKAILLNLLSVGAAYGLLVLVFQKGIGGELIGAQQTAGITTWLPLFLFVVLFGLSMDYHVFILSRVREAYDRGMNSDAAVAYGIKSTAGVVTSAAMVMVGVFSIFATLSMVDFKQMGVGLAAAVLIDATIVRAVLLPATMKLLGERNWYLPSWLEWLPQVRHEGSVAEPARSKPERTGPAPSARPATDIAG